MKRIAILGSTGMAGHVLAQDMEERGFDVYRTSRSERDTPRSAAINVTDFHALGTWLDMVAPDAVVNCVGLLQRACTERPDLAVLINSYLPHYLERRYTETSVRIVHLSTDCVLSGARGEYREGDATDGMTPYDRSKALGELHNDKDLTFRMSIIGPDIDPAGTGLFNWFMAQKGDIQGYGKTIWNGVTTVELSRAVDCALHEGLTGLYHLVSAVPIDKCSLLELAKTVFDNHNVTIYRVDGPVVDKSLVNTRTDFSFEVQDYPHQLSAMRTWIDAHRALYPHYGFS